MRNNIDQVEKRRVLKKVRRNFLNKTQQNQGNLVIPVPAPIVTENYNTIDPFLFAVEKNRKMYFGIHYVQSHYNIANISVDEASFTKIVTLNLQLKDFDWPALWEMGLKRLESYGDLDLATMGWRIRDHRLKCPIVVEKCQELVQSKDPIVLSNLKRAKNRAVMMAKDIESKYLYKKTVGFMDKNSCKMLSISYSKEMIEQIGYNIEDFVDWVKGNGVPCIFKGDSTLYHDIMKVALNSYASGSDLSYERPEFVITITDKSGTKKEVVAQYFAIVEPVLEGVFVSGYIIIKRVNQNLEKNSILECISDLNLKMKKSSLKDVEDSNGIESKENVENM